MAADILSLLAGGYTIGQIQGYYPEPREEDVKESISYAATLVQEEESMMKFTRAG